MVLQKPITSGAVYTALLNKLNTSLKGAINGLAELDSSGKSSNISIANSYVG